MQEDHQKKYEVVVNHEEQYSIWPIDRMPPPGWRAVGFSGAKAACLEHIRTVWVDTTPLSLRERSRPKSVQPVEVHPATTTSKLDAWFKRFGDCKDAARRLICFHHAGGGPSLFRNWQRYCPADVEILAIASPGREARLNEKPFDNMGQYVDSLLAVLPTDKPFAFFGHSLGAVISFELARQLHERGMPVPAHLFVSACPAPKLDPEPDPTPPPSDQALIEDITSMGGTPREILESPELLQMLLLPLRADYKLMDDYVVPRHCHVRFPVTAYSGTADKEVPLNDILAWEHWAERGFELRTFAGDHFYLKDHEDILIQDIVRRWPALTCPIQETALDAIGSMAV
jgi:surfactin synthase thioesterase subunit/uncharacterized protein YbdZ (MbtH family)